MTDIVSKVSAACSWGTPSAAATVEIVDEVRQLVAVRETVMAQLSLISMARKNNPEMADGPLLDLLGDVVDELCRAVDFDD